MLQSVNVINSHDFLFYFIDNSLEKYEKIVTVQSNCSSKRDELCVTPKSEVSGECYVSYWF